MQTFAAPGLFGDEQAEEARLRREPEMLHAEVPGCQDGVDPAVSSDERTTWRMIRT